MNKSIGYIFFVIVLLQGCRQGEDRPLPPLNESYKKEDKKPFGSYVAFNHLETLFDDKYIQTMSQSFDKTWSDIRDYSSNTQYSIYFLLAKNIEVSSDEAAAMVDFISEGNDMFIAADYIDHDLLDTIRLKQNGWMRSLKR